MNREESKDLMDLLWKMYSENTTHGRHHETQRSTVSNLILVLAGALLTFTTVDKAINRADLPAAILVAAIGLFGAVFCAQHYARYRQHVERAKHYRTALDALLPPMDDPDLSSLRDRLTKGLDVEVGREAMRAGVLTAIKRVADHRFHAKEISKIAAITPGGLHSLWIGLHVLVAVLGGMLAIAAVWWPKSWN